ncbi:hypothetical protein V1477_012534 [Vespula maculifrons]|uniref:Uncharacterized protein n=1 Tax=Vespula maculifrons TaxID=7453 RepID=A0ABD2BXT4_VESMC
MVLYCQPQLLTCQEGQSPGIVISWSFHTRAATAAAAAAAPAAVVTAAPAPTVVAGSSQCDRTPFPLLASNSKPFCYVTSLLHQDL